MASCTKCRRKDGKQANEKTSKKDEKEVVVGVAATILAEVAALFVYATIVAGRKEANNKANIQTVLCIFAENLKMVVIT